MSRTLKFSIIVALLVLLAPRLVLFLASMSLFIIAIPVVTALIYFGPTLWKIWKVRNAIKQDSIHNKYKTNNQASSQNKSSKSRDYIDLDKDDFSVIDDNDK